MSVPFDLRRIFLEAIKRALHKRSVRWSLGGLSLTRTLLIAVLLLTVQLQWIPAPWPFLVMRILFEALLGTSLLNIVVFGAPSIWSATYLLRRRTDSRADAMTILRRGFVTPADCMLCALWSWAWLAAGSPRLFAAMLIGLHIVHSVILVGYYFRKARQKTLAADTQAVKGRSRRRGIVSVLQTCGRIHLQKVRWAVWRWWWERTHRDFLQNLPPANRELFISAVRGLTHNVEVFLARGADPNLRVKFDIPLIGLCASLDRNETVRLLLGAGANVNAAAPSTGVTALHNAARMGNVALAKLLIERGADLEARMKSKATPLMLAARSGSTEAVAILLKSGAKLDATDRTDRTALDYARRKNHPEVVEMLVEARSHKVSSEL